MYKIFLRDVNTDLQNFCAVSAAVRCSVPLLSRLLKVHKTEEASVGVAVLSTEIVIVTLVAGMVTELSADIVIVTLNL